jgi:hypothetical protein
MVSLNFSVVGYKYQRGLDALIASYHHSNSALTDRAHRNLVLEAQYGDLIEQGGPEIGEWDEDGFRVWSQDQVLALDVEIAEAAVGELRKAFLIAIYHHWERAIRVVTGDMKAKHADLIKKAVNHNISISPELERVVRAANALKHNNDKRGGELHDIWPEVFGGLFFKPKPGIDWYAAIDLDDKHIEMAVNAVAASGPQIHPAKP